ncbi:hypothetical protein Emtol_1759 [Emticicia oligotrophica DSM 17448]|uniref:Single-stranded DNA-binding protein n=1 Tax=Emticicia oligotrophica (strain DSM 17448 / CIP 109782 / MTCC 6937 / GPTSA100-15) TaxID=929562 RepID=A0ABM5N0M8_EMTOG|nr:hypothetical protein Emtol_1759 [Emticicia oligotrophica DSM 17448]
MINGKKFLLVGMVRLDKKNPRFGEDFFCIKLRYLLTNNQFTSN